MEVVKLQHHTNLEYKVIVKTTTYTYIAKTVQFGREETLRFIVR